MAQQMTDAQLIAEAVADGRVRRFRMGESSEWDALPFKERRSILMKAAKRDYRLRNTKR